MKRPAMHQTAEPMVSFVQMIRMLSEEILELIEVPPSWFPLVYDRKDQAALSNIEQERFLCAFNTLAANGTLGQLVKIHGELHYHHGTQRFLPWHRVYLFLLDQALKAVHPEVSIPYWNWTDASEQSFPSWLVAHRAHAVASGAHRRQPFTWIARRPRDDRRQHPDRVGAGRFRELHGKPGGNSQHGARVGRRRDVLHPDRSGRPDLLDAPLQYRPALGDLAVWARRVESEPSRAALESEQRRDGSVVVS